jgi:hypothetical protein
MSVTLSNAIDKLGKTEERVQQFSDLLDSLKSTEEKKKLLWKEIYENALVDRENASMLFTDAWKHMSGGTSEHATLGPTMSKYLERMCKSNEQILRLSELIAKAEERDSKINPDDIFNQIDGG